MKRSTEVDVGNAVIMLKSHDILKRKGGAPIWPIYLQTSTVENEAGLAIPQPQKAGECRAVVGWNYWRGKTTHERLSEIQHRHRLKGV